MVGSDYVLIKVLSEGKKILQRTLNVAKRGIMPDRQSYYDAYVVWSE